MLEDVIKRLRKFRRKRNSKLFFQEEKPKFSYKIPNIIGVFFSKKKESIITEPKEKKSFISILKFLFWGTFFIGLFAGMVVLGWVIYVTSKTPSIEDLGDKSFAQSSVILDSSGQEVLYTLFNTENRKNVALSDISKNMIEAMLAAEDADFYNHAGLDWMGIGRSVVYGIMERRAVGGGSTITQQLIKNVIFAGKNETFQQKVERKIQELTLARRLETKYTKDKILEMYLNNVPFGRNSYGIERAANAYFGKSAKNLSIAESAFLAGLPQAPGRYARYITSALDLTQEEIEELNITSFSDLMSREREVRWEYTKGVFGQEFTFAGGNKEYVPARFDYVLGQMYEKKFITKQEYEAAKEEGKTLEIKKDITSIKAPHFVHYVEKELSKILGEEYSEEQIKSGGLKIYTTLDYELHQKVNEVITAQGEFNEEYNIRNAAALVMKPNTGEIQVMIGSRDYFSKEADGDLFDGEVNILTSKRQPGSTFKPIAYSAAFEQKGFGPATILMDVETDFGNKYIPQNFDKKFHGPISIRKALGNSYNIPAIKAGIIAGLSNVFQLSENMGLSFERSIDFYGSAISLGTAEVRPIDMGIAYSVFANGGYRVTPTVISKIVNKKGEVIYEFTPPSEEESIRVLTPETSFLITHILKDETVRGEGWSSILSLSDREVAAKTGTTTAKDKNGKNKPHDAWTIGYTPQYVAVVWAGNNKGWEENPYGILSENASGLKNAGSMWQKIMEEAHKEKEAISFSVPSGVREIPISKISGKTPVEDFPEELVQKDYFSTSYLPSSEDQSLKIIRLVESSKLLPTEFTPVKATKEYAYIALNSYFPDRKEWEEPVKEWIESEEGKEWVSSLSIPDLIVEMPTEEDPRYTEEVDPPKIRITAPSTMGIVSPPSITVTAEVDSEKTISRVDFYWDNELVATKKQAPWDITLPISGEQGTKHVLRAEVVDRSFFMGEHSIEVAIGEDVTAPKLNITYPLEGVTLKQNILHEIKAIASDSGSGIDFVEFFLNGESIGKQKSSPFTIPWDANVPSGKQTLIVDAYDGSGNKTSQSIRFLVAPNQAEQIESNQLQILKPFNDQAASSPIIVSLYVPEKYRSLGSNISVKAKKKREKEVTIYKTSKEMIPESGIISFAWEPTSAGEYSLNIAGEIGFSKEFSRAVKVHVK